MSVALKWIVALIVVAAVGWLVWWSGILNKKSETALPNQNASATSTEEVPQNGMSKSNDASDAAVAQDTAAIDAQLSAYASDSSSVDSSMNDKAVSQ